MNKDTKKEEIDLDEKGMVVKPQFPLFLKEAHFKRYESEYAWSYKSLV